MKKVLIINYYWPPAGGGGVMRWLKMSTYLNSDTDWTPIIYTPKNAGYLVCDKSLLKDVPKDIEVVKKQIIEPNNFLSLLGMKSYKKSFASGGISFGTDKKSFKEQFILWVRSNVFIPDARFLWIKPSTKFLVKYIKQNSIDVVVTTGPPHSMHLIGLNLKKKLKKIKWIADFRDPWTYIDFFKDLELNSKSLNEHFKLEKEVIHKADALVTVSPSWATQYKKMYGRDFHVINNGFDQRDFLKKKPILDKEFTITYIGSLNKDRSSKILWEAIDEICKENSNFQKDLKINLIGAITPELDLLFERKGLKRNISIENFKPHNEVINLIRKSQLLLFLLNDTNSSYVQGHIPGKLYEYLGAERPILGIGDTKADAAKIIQTTKSGVVIDFNNKLDLKKAFEFFYNEYKLKGKLESKTENIKKYSRKSEAMEFAALLDKQLVS